MSLTQPAFICSKLVIETLDKRYELYSKLTISEPRYWRGSGVFIVNFEHIFTAFSNIYIVDFELVNAGWVACYMM